MKSYAYTLCTFCIAGVTLAILYEQKTPLPFTVCAQIKLCSDSCRHKHTLQRSSNSKHLRAAKIVYVKQVIVEHQQNDTGAICTTISITNNYKHPTMLKNNAPYNFFFSSINYCKSCPVIKYENCML